MYTAMTEQRGEDPRDVFKAAQAAGGGGAPAGDDGAAKAAAEEAAEQAAAAHGGDHQAGRGPQPPLLAQELPRPRAAPRGRAAKKP